MTLCIYIQILLNIYATHNQFYFILLFLAFFCFSLTTRLNLNSVFVFLI